jgi:hypothetical protein
MTLAQQVLAEDERVAGGGDGAVVHVVTPARLELEVSWLDDPHQLSAADKRVAGKTATAWPLVTRRRYSVQAVATDVEGHRILLTHGTAVRGRGARMSGAHTPP